LFDFPNLSKPVRCVNVKNMLNNVDFIFRIRTLLLKKSTLYALCKVILQILIMKSNHTFWCYTLTMYQYL